MDGVLQYKQLRELPTHVCTLKKIFPTHLQLFRYGEPAVNALEFHFYLEESNCSEALARPLETSPLLSSISTEIMRRHGWQRPLHMLQLLGMGIYVVMVLAFYLFLGSFLGNNALETTAVSIFSFVAFSVMILFLRCSSIDPIDKSSLKNSVTKTSATSSRQKACVLLAQLVVRYVKKTVRCVKKMEKKFLHSCIRRRYTDPWKTTAEMELNFPSIVTKHEGISPGFSQDDITFCSFCNRNVKKRSKHCKSCDKCVDGFDHHCRWLNNCVGRRNYTTFMLLMAAILIMLLLEGGAGVVVFIQCFANKRGIMHELEFVYGHRFPRWVFAVVVLFLILISAYASAAIGQLFFFHIVLIKKGIRTYDYILAMREDCRTEDFLDESDILSLPSSPASSVESFDGNHKFHCISKHQEISEETRRLSLENDLESELHKTRKPDNANINPWRLIKLSKDEALKAAERARERSSMFKRPSATETHRQGYASNTDTTKEGQSETVHIITKSDYKPSPPLLMPLPQERKCGPSINASYVASPAAGEMEAMPLLMQNLPKPKTQFGRGRQQKADSYTSLSLPMYSSKSFASPRLPCSRDRAYSTRSKSLSFTSPLALHHRTSFDLGLTEVSTQLETYISKQVVSSLFRQTREEGSPVQ